MASRTATAVPIVPVAHAAQILRQRSCGGRGDSSRRRVGQRLEGDERAQHIFTKLPVIGATSRPIAPPAIGLLDGPPRIDRRRYVFVRRVPDQREKLALPGRDHEIGGRLEIMILQMHRRDQLQVIGPGDRGKAGLDPSHPRNNGAIIEANDQLHRHPHLPALPLDDANHIRRLCPHRHAVDHRDGAVGCFVFGFEHERTFSIASARRLNFADRGQQPPPTLRAAEQCGKTGAGIKARQAEPIDGAVAANERRSMAVADEGIVFDMRRH